MKLTFLLLTCFVVQTFAGLNAQTVTIKKQNASLEEVIWELKQQTRFTFMYNNEDIARIKGIDLNEKEVDVEEILRKCLQNTNLEYVVLNNAIVIKLKMNTSDEKKVYHAKRLGLRQEKRTHSGSDGQTDRYQPRNGYQQQGMVLSFTPANQRNTGIFFRGL